MAGWFVGSLLNPGVKSYIFDSDKLLLMNTSFYVINLINKLMKSHNAPTINVNEVSCVVKWAGALIEILR